MQDFERLGVFYLGREYDLAAKKPTRELVLYDAKDLTTHAVCVGMTGSGKTGLCLALLEEAAIDNIPAIIIDPKGDLSNLLLTFPQLRPEDFEPWVDPAEATRQGVTPAQLGAKTAEQWKKGLADWCQDGARIQRMRDAVDMAIYTPGSSAGLPLTVLRSFDAPPASTRDNNEAMREAVAAAAAGLLGLLGIDADPLKSREHILIASILDRAWRDEKSLDMPALIRAIQSPSFDKVGVIDLESFFPAKERFELAMQLNNLLASPGFSAWMEGEPLDVQRLLYTLEGKPRLSILSIAHLSDAERMFFVTILLSETIGWMRSQQGTSSLRAILYMDEVFGYFPPSKNPPSKGPMLTLLKQARAFGLGVVLATQNPVDLDYKGLANCGTWFLGRLQTERDKLRVLDGLEGASTAAGGSFDRAEMERILSGLGSRVFLMNNVHEDHPVVFQSRWALSYLRGPLTREQIAKLMEERKATTAPSGLRAEREEPAAPGKAAAARPVLPPEITERFAARRANLPEGANLIYRPALLGQVKLHFAQTAAGVDHWQDVSLLLPIGDAVPAETWAKAEEREEELETEKQPEGGAKFTALPAELSRAKRYTELATALKDYLYRNRKLQLWKCPPLKQTSSAGESQSDFRVRLAQRAREERDAQVAALRQKYAPKIASVQEQLRKAQIRVDKEKSQATERTLSAALSMGTSILGALFSRKWTSAGNLSRAASSMRQASRIARERQDVSDASGGVEALQERLSSLEAELKGETDAIGADLAPDKLRLEEVLVQPKKSEINVSGVTLVWLPWIVRPDGISESAA
jgi:Helicase HerA, central domain